MVAGDSLQASYSSTAMYFCSIFVSGKSSVVNLTTPSPEMEKLFSAASWTEGSGGTSYRKELLLYRQHVSQRGDLTSNHFGTSASGERLPHRSQRKTLHFTHNVKCADVVRHRNFAIRMVKSRTLPARPIKMTPLPWSIQRKASLVSKSRSEATAARGSVENTSTRYCCLVRVSNTNQ